MGTEVAIPEDRTVQGPAMEALNERQREFVRCCVEHPNYNATQLAELAGYKGSPEAMRVQGHRLRHNEGVIAAINEVASKRLRGAGLLGVSVMVEIASNPAHKDQLKAATALADRTGFHALSEHKVTVEDKRPQTKKEMIAAIVQLGREQGMSDEEIKKWTGGEIIDAEFTEVIPATDAEIVAQMEDL